jgi:hypothetical protein
LEIDRAGRENAEGVRKIFRFLLAFIVAFGAIAYAESQSKIIIRGQVIYEPTGKPLANVRVELIRPDRSLAARIRAAGNEGTLETSGVTGTGSDGKFSFETNRPGPYEIMCFRGGGHIAGGDANVDPRKFVLIKYKADPAPVILGPTSKKQ